MEGIKTDEILKELNPFGRVQVWFLLSSAYLQFFLPMNGQSINFLGATPDFHCSARDGYLLNESVPATEDNKGERVFSQCEEYKVPGLSNETQDCQNSWTYSKEYYSETIITEWDLVCRENAAAETSQSVQQLGGLIGATLFGMLADRFGRRPTFLAGLILYDIAGIGLCFSPNYAVFTITRFFTGFSQMAAWTVFISNVSEYMIPKYRNRSMTVPVISFSFGLMFMSLLAFLIRDWRYLQLAIVLPVVMATVLLWFLPESLRWMMMNRDNDKEMNRLLRRLSQINNKPLAEDVALNTSPGVSGDGIMTISGNNIPSPSLSKENERTEEVKTTTEAGQAGSSESEMKATKSDGGQGTKSDRGQGTTTKDLPKTSKFSYLDLLKPPILHVTAVTSLTRFTFTFVYFGFALSTGRLAGSPYLNFFFSAVVEIPARLLSPFLYSIMRRTYLMSVSFAACGAGLIAIIFIPQQTKSGLDLTILQTVLSLSGKFFVTLSLGGILLVTTELFPTTLRNSGNGLSLSIGRLGAVIAPFVLYLDNLVFEYFSITLMAVSSLVTAVCVLTLPDTRRTLQPQNAAELKLIMSSSRKESTMSFVNNSFNKDT